MTKTSETRSILIVHSDGRETIVEGIPANAKLTYGPLVPGRDGYHNGNALRIYTTASNQLAVFRSVESFRDLSLKIKQKAIITEIDETDEDGPYRKRNDRTVKQTGEWQEVTPF